MSYAVRWRKAIVLSVFFHIFFGVAVGYMTARLTVSPPIEEQVIELDVTAVSDGEHAEPAPELKPEVPAPSMTAPQPIPQDTPQLTEPPPPAVSDDITELAPIKATAIDMTAAASSGKHSVMGTPPIVLVRADPIYPPDVSQISRKVVVVLKMRIMENGMPGKIEVAVSSGQKSINDAAIAAAKKWRFEPAKDREGHPMVCSTILSIPFTPK